MQQISGERLQDHWSSGTDLYLGSVGCVPSWLKIVAWDVLHKQNIYIRVVGGNMAPAHWGLGEIDGLLVAPGKASTLLTDHLITC